MEINKLMPIYYMTFVTRDFVRSHSDWFFVFGDNMQRKGLGGQAKEMRGEFNSIGIPTKWKPSDTDDSYFCNDDWEDGSIVKSTILQDLKKIEDCLKSKQIVIVPMDGLGTGRAMLNDKAPIIFNYIQQQIQMLRKMY